MNESFDVPLITVVMATFNRARLITRAINSLLAQTFEDWELIIIDDGSKDSTQETISPYLSYTNILYRHFPNSGVAVSRDRGSELARGRYITFLDSDDEYLPDHLESRANILSAKPAIELLHGGVEIIGDDTVADKNDPTKQILIADCVVGGTFFVRRDLWKRLGGFGSEAYGDDSDFFDRAVAKGATIIKTEIPTYRYYRNEEDSICNIVSREGVAGIEQFRNQ